MEDLKNKIIREMTSDHKSALERCFESAKLFLKLTTTGKVELLNKDKFSAEEQVLIYLIGKVYSYEAGYSQTKAVSAKELMEELGKPEGTIKPCLKNLRDSHKVKSDKDGRSASYSISNSAIEITLINLKKKIE